MPDALPHNAGHNTPTRVSRRPTGTPPEPRVRVTTQDLIDDDEQWFPLALHEDVEHHDRHLDEVLAQRTIAAMAAEPTRGRLAA